MKSANMYVCAIILILAVGCSHGNKSKKVTDANMVQSEMDPAHGEAQKKAMAMTEGWPQSSLSAATEMIEKHGEPTERTEDSLIWRSVPPFERIIVHKNVHSSRFPTLHQNAVDHVVTYKVPTNKVGDVRRFNGDVSIDSTKGEMTASGQSESMNMLNLNMASEVVSGKLTPEQARTQLEKETLNLMNGQPTTLSQGLTFGRQMNTGDTGQSMTKDMQWGTKQAEEASPADEKKPKTQQ